MGGGPRGPARGARGGARAAGGRGGPRGPARGARGAARAAGGRGGGGGSVVVLGGAGRVGASSARWLLELLGPERVPAGGVVLAGRPSSGAGPAFEAACGRIDAALPPALRGRLRPARCDAESAESVQDLVAREGAELVVHAAGPFQGRSAPAALEGCLAAGVPFVDVCDDSRLVAAGLALSERAREGGVAAVTSAGIWPGVSALLAAEASERVGGAETLELSFFTAGTGGAGTAVVAATFLLLEEPVGRYAAGVEAFAEPWTEPRRVDFGGAAGERTVFLLDNPEVGTLARHLGAQNVSSRFATAPGAWNALFGGMRAALPGSLLADRGFASGLARFSMPVIRTVDLAVGSRNAMHVRAVGGDGAECCLRVQHPTLESCVGLGTAAFAVELLQGGVPPGVWAPPELPAACRRRILERARRESDQWEV